MWWHNSRQLPVPGNATTRWSSSPLLEQAPAPWVTGMDFGIVQLLVQPGPWGGTAGVLVSVQSPGEAARMGMCSCWRCAGHSRGAAAGGCRQLIALTAVPAGRLEAGCATLCMLASMELSQWGDAAAAQRMVLFPPPVMSGIADPLQRGFNL